MLLQMIREVFQDVLEVLGHFKQAGSKANQGNMLNSSRENGSMTQLCHVVEILMN